SRPPPSSAMSLSLTSGELAGLRNFWTPEENAETDRLLRPPATTPSPPPLPPRSGKAEMPTIRYPVWRMERWPTTRICVGCYSQQFAERFGRRARRLAEARFPLAADRRRAAAWATARGGG